MPNDPITELAAALALLDQSMNENGNYRFSDCLAVISAARRVVAEPLPVAVREAVREWRDAVAAEGPRPHHSDLRMIAAGNALATILNHVAAQAQSTKGTP